MNAAIATFADAIPSSPRSGGQNLTGLDVEIYTPSAPSHGAARKWVQNRNVWVLLTSGNVKTIRSPSILAQHLVAYEVDSRYDGPRSAYGQAIRRAAEIVDDVADLL